MTEEYLQYLEYITEQIEKELAFAVLANKTAEEYYASMIKIVGEIRIKIEEEKTK